MTEDREAMLALIEEIDDRLSRLKLLLGIGVRAEPTP
jgi:hypothetical protein